MRLLNHFRLTIGLAWRYLVGHRRKNALIGALLVFNAAFVVVAASVVDTVGRHVFSLIRTSVLGDFTVVSADGPDTLWITEASTGNPTPDVGTINLPKVRKFLEETVGATAVVPMGTLQAMCILPNPIEAAVEELRRALIERNPERISAFKRRLRERLDTFDKEMRRIASTPGLTGLTEEEGAALTHVRAESFWQRFDQDWAASIAYLENFVVPLGGDTEEAWLPVIGTDHQAFRKGFDRYKLVKGTWPPPGKRGIVLNSLQWDIYYKLPLVRELENLHKDLVLQKKEIADPILRERVQGLVNASEDLILPLKPTQLEELSLKLKAFLKTEQGTVRELVQQFLNVDRDTIDARYRFLTGELASVVRLYRIEPGDQLLMRAWGQFPTSISVKFYGVIEIPAFRKILPPNHYAFIDLVSFRVLDGEISPEMEADFAALKNEVQPRDMLAADVEKMFASTASLVVDDSALGKPVAIEEGASKGTVPEEFTQQEIDNGRVEHAAVFLPPEMDIDEAIERVETLSAAAGVPLLTAGPLQALMFLTYNMLFFRGLITAGALVILVVTALVSLLAISVVVVGRIREIGILRAIGSSPIIAVEALIMEMTFLGFVAGGVGLGAGLGLTKWLAVGGIPAPSPTIALLFGGPRLFPEVSLTSALLGILLTTLVAFVATLFPARQASRVQPVIALR